ncbi:proteinase [Paraphoma chrysanthemicola]|uniref:Proteinase n=1 Tax=Paraphoma chrysanthemicola TaxID=798071 RepID=A0A8K0RFW4_9PLEO|nr:proteinase [Paraphoma chrysanthemicola]
MRSSSLWNVFLLELPFALAYPHQNQKSQNISSISWSNCTFPLATPGACGTLKVPLDYTHSSSKETLDLQFVRADAVKKPSRGSILINQGGPGLDGQQFTATFGAALQVMFGGYYDIIGFDPRGTGKTLPLNCSPNPSERFRFSLLAPATTNSSNTALGASWAYSDLLAQACYENGRDVGDLMGTAFVARDMIQIVDALDEDGMLRYWGQSYGTYLGATVAAMFPERIDKLVIDGVIDPVEEYDPAPAGDLALNKYLEACIATKNQTLCPLYRPNATAESLTNQIRDLVEEVKFEPIVMGSNTTTDLVTYVDIKGAINNPLRLMIAYATPLAGWLNAILTRDTTTYRLLRPRVVADPATLDSTLDAVQNIRCTDTTWRTDNIEEARDLVHRVSNSSSLYGDVYASSFLACSKWRMQAKGRYEGDFKTKTKNPILIIGSPYDLRTPLISAQKVNKLFDGSVLLQHNGYGHCVMYSPGQCAINAVQTYFTNGTLPNPGTTCEQDYGIFSGKTIWDSFGVAPPS